MMLRRAYASPDHRRVDATGKTVRGAGGLVCRRGPAGGLEVVLVHRRAYDDWEFPKGKLDQGETEPDAALREVEEETGLRCRLGREIGSSSYVDFRGRPKIVRYWEMHPVAGTLAPAHEVDAARWVPLAELREALSHDRDRTILDQFERLL
jgi:8-oxo-dGTP diphosphatase